ncbi:hypothetical protein [Virgibacillus necropolis]|nr:hypothetical protein [Virgibacillus necropolis]
MKKNKELPTFTILNPEFHTPEQETTDMQNMQENGEETTVHDEISKENN